MAPSLGILTRRAALAVALVALTLPAGAGAKGKPQPSTIRIAPAGEPGEPLVVSGTVYGEDGSTPAAGVSLHVHQTDARGYYSSGMSPLRTRLQGRLVTDARGRYEISTIVPGSYPERRTPAHIHVKASGGGFPEQYPHEFWFEGDPDITAEMRSRVGPVDRFSPICRTTRDASGVQRCLRDIRLSRKPRAMPH